VRFLQNLAFLFCLILACFLAGADPADLTTADFFMKYFNLIKNSNAKKPSSESQNPTVNAYEVPSWYKKYCLRKKVSDDCSKNSLTKDELNKLLEHFNLARYNSLKGGAINAALTAAKLRPHEAFEILNETTRLYPKEFEFDKIDALKAEYDFWKKLSESMPVVKTHAFTVNNADFVLKMQSDGKKYAIKIYSSTNELVFTDGPRWISHKNDAALRELSTSMMKTWTTPSHRGFGLYQYAILFYLDNLKIKNTYLYTENDATLSFIYRMKQVIYSDETRLKLLKIRGIKEFLQENGVDLEKFAAGHMRQLKSGEKYLNYLSLQGRTRLNIGLSIRLDEDEHAIVHSRRMRPLEAAKIKKSVQALEVLLFEDLAGDRRTTITEILPESYYSKFDLQREREEKSKKCIATLVGA
jgi:hypothetical protein